jgi:hypothetical protein
MKNANKSKVNGKHKRKQIGSVIVAVCLLLSYAVFTLASGAEFAPETQSPVIDAALLEKMKGSGENDLLPVDVWFKEINADTVEQMVKDEIGLNREAIRSSVYGSELGIIKEDKFSSEEIDKYIETERKIYSKMQLDSHKDFIRKHSDLKGLEQACANGTVFISAYAPNISLGLTKSDIERLAGCG